jgi:hypothetical protein
VSENALTRSNRDVSRSDTAALPATRSSPVALRSATGVALMATTVLASMVEAAP